VWESTALRKGGERLLGLKTPKKWREEEGITPSALAGVQEKKGRTNTPRSSGRGME